jgi:hypothetical protein
VYSPVQGGSGQEDLPPGLGRVLHAPSCSWEQFCFLSAFLDPVS